MADRLLLTGEQALLLLRKVVFEKGADYVYKGPNPDRPTICYNVWDGQPSCIIGHVLAELGLKASDYEDQALGAELSITSLAGLLRSSKTFEWDISGDAVKVLSVAQEMQDEGHSWGAALEAAQIDFERIAAER